MTTRLALFSLMLAGTLAAQADRYQWLTIEKNDGTTLSLTAIGLNITYSGGNLNAANGAETATVALSDIRRMYFSNQQNADGVEAPRTNPDKDDKMYDLNGHAIPKNAPLTKGVYIVNPKDNPKKITVK